MPRVDEDQGDTGAFAVPLSGKDASSGEAERFTARDDQGNAYTVVKQAAKLAEDAAGGLHWQGGASNFALLDGTPVERIDESTFRIVRTGTTLRREEGLHGVTHHPEHQTPAGKGPA